MGRRAIAVLTVVFLGAAAGCGLFGGEEEAPPGPTLSEVDAVIYLDEELAPAVIDDGASAASSVVIDYDVDDDGLIEIKYLEHLNAVRYDLDGDGFPSDAMAYLSSFEGAQPGMGCPEDVCSGYELTADLDFYDPASYADGTVSREWIDSVHNGWVPIGDAVEKYDALFNGNGHTVSSLFIRQMWLTSAGLFGSVGARAGVVRDLNLRGARVEGINQTGALVGDNAGRVIGCYADGTVTGREDVGGLVGINQPRGVVRASGFEGRVSGWRRVGGLVGYNSDGFANMVYAVGEVTGISDAGGLIGLNGLNGRMEFGYARSFLNSGYNGGGLVGRNAGDIRLAYSLGRVHGRGYLGGLVGYNERHAHVSYAVSRVAYGESDLTLTGGAFGKNDGSPTAVIWDTRLSGVMNGAAVGDPSGVSGYDTEVLQRPDDYAGIYSRWDISVDGDSVGDDPWDMGSWIQYPVLKVDIDGDGEVSADEFGNQLDFR